MPHPESEHGLRVQLATALRERDEARTDAANLRFANDAARRTSEKRLVELTKYYEAHGKELARAEAAESALAAANARADAADAKLAELRLLKPARADLIEALAAARRECELPESVKLIAAERKRQVEQEGWTAEHDDEHAKSELARAASCYAFPDVRGYMPLNWPWSSDWWKPGKDRIRQLVKAGALIAAEIERLQRAALAAPAAAAHPQRCACGHPALPSCADMPWTPAAAVGEEK